MYEIHSLNHDEAEMEEFKRFTFGTRSFNPYHLHFLVENHFARVYHPWIHSACHWPKQDPWRYCYNYSWINELVRVVVEWLGVHKATTSQRAATSTTIEGSRPVHDKGKRKVVDSAEAE